MKDKIYIFGYGSLVHPKKLFKFLNNSSCSSRPYQLCRLQGYRRCWNVAMNNKVDIPGYKYYLNPQTTERPNLFVTFLNIRPSPKDYVNGLAFEVSQTELEKLNQREKNYQIIDVTAAIDSPLAGRVFSYIGKSEARQRFDEGLQLSTSVINQVYLEAVLEAFSSHSPDFLAEYHLSTDKPEIPVVALEQVKLPSLKDN